LALSLSFAAASLALSLPFATAVCFGGIFGRAKLGGRRTVGRAAVGG
jgi:hypothetical protein